MISQEETAPSEERPLSRVYAALFLGAICLPLVRTLGGSGGEGAAREQRRAARMPALSASVASWSTFPRRFEDWYASEFRFRGALMREHNRFKWFGLGTSPSEKVVRGRDDWVFYAENRTLDQVRGAYPLAEPEVEAWVAMLEERRAWAEEHGSRYLFVVAPVKASVYADYLPPGFEPVGPGRLDQLTEALRQGSEVAFLDLRASLVDERSNDRGEDWTYYPLGTHWTRRGALRGWREIVAAVPEVFESGPPPLDDLERVLHADKQGDSWASRLYLEDELRQEEWVLRLPPGPRAREQAYSRQGARYERGEPGDGPHVTLFHDSFGSYLRPLLARSCGTLSCVWRYAWDLALIEAERPDLVIDLVVERTLVALDPAGMPLRTQARLREGYEGAREFLWSLSADELSARNWAAPATDDASGYRTLALPDLAGEEGTACWIALEVESEGGGLLEVSLCERDAAGEVAAPRRSRSARAFAPPGRHTVYLARSVPVRSSALLLGVEHAGWKLHRAEARSAEATR